jgi:tRNA (guanine-N7-)-methyltransferase
MIDMTVRPPVLKSHPERLGQGIPEDRKHINPYVGLIEDYSPWVFMEEQARLLRGEWKNLVFNSPRPLDVEIGTGNGFHFSHYAETHPERSLVGFEIKFKTVVQSIARARRGNCENVKMVKGDASKLSEYFAENEVQKIIVHFPDPWPKPRQQKNRLLNREFFREAYRVLAPGGTLEFKTDHFGYFQSATQQVAGAELMMDFYTEDLHHSFKSHENFVTQFESLFLRKNQPIFFFSLKKV